MSDLQSADIEYYGCRTALCEMKKNELVSLCNDTEKLKLIHGMRRYKRDVEIEPDSNSTIKMFYLLLRH